MAASMQMIAEIVTSGVGDGEGARGQAVQFTDKRHPSVTASLHASTPEKMIEALDALKFSLQGYIERSKQ